jgi:hypothetical protein
MANAERGETRRVRADAPIDTVAADAAMSGFNNPPLTRQPEIPTGQIATLSEPDPVPRYADEPVMPAETVEMSQTSVDRYLWSVYQRTLKTDMVKMSERIKVTVKKKGKTRIAFKTVTKLVDEDFTWKDPKAAQKANLSLMDYVIGGMEQNFKLRLYYALRALDEVGLSPGITSGFRDDYRQSLASGLKAANDSSYHGGSRRGGYGHGLAADIVSTRGDSRAERWRSTEELWKWIDAHGKEFGVGRPYLDRDPPHVAPIDGREYAVHRGEANAQLAILEWNKHREAGDRHLMQDPDSPASNAQGEVYVPRTSSSVGPGVSLFDGE